jgi:hypothetical protein
MSTWDGTSTPVTLTMMVDLARDGITEDADLTSLVELAHAVVDLFGDDRISLIAERMVSSSGPWIDCPFCGDDGPPAPERIFDGADHSDAPYPWHRPACLLHLLRGRGDE